MEPKTHHPTNYWLDTFRGYTSCNFPSLQKNNTVPGHRTQTKLVLQDCTDLESFCSQQEISPTAVFQLAWALVLQLYVSTDLVTFGYFSQNHGGRAGVASGPVLQLCNIELNGDEIASVIKQVDVQFERSLAYGFASWGDMKKNQMLQGIPSFNTTMTVIDLPESASAFKDEGISWIDSDDKASKWTKLIDRIRLLTVSSVT